MDMFSNMKEKFLGNVTKVLKVDVLIKVYDLLSVISLGLNLAPSYIQKVTN